MVYHLNIYSKFRIDNHESHLSVVVKSCLSARDIFCLSSSAWTTSYSQKYHWAIPIGDSQITVNVNVELGLINNGWSINLWDNVISWSLWTKLKKDKDRREGKGRRYCLGDGIDGGMDVLEKWIIIRYENGCSTKFFSSSNQVFKYVPPTNTEDLCLLFCLYPASTVSLNQVGCQLNYRLEDPPLLTTIEEGCHHMILR